MNVKRVFIVLLALIIVASSLSAVSAGLLDGLFGSSQNNITDIGGFQFNIPDGYQLDNSSNNYENRYSMLYQSSMMTIFNNSSSLPQDNQIPAGNFFTAMDDDFKSSVVSSINNRIHNDTAMNYVNSAENKTFEILIEHPMQGKEISKDSINSNKTINGIDGIFKEKSGSVEFVYLKDGSAIHIIAPDEGLISNIVVNK